MMLIIPYLITLFTGYLALITLFRNDRPLPTLLFFTLSALTGISITIILTFLSFIFLNRFHLVFIIFAHALIIIPLLWISGKNIALRNMTLNKDTGLELLMAAGSGIISFLYAKAYPMGGWDAWLLWNFKSKFLLLSGTRWKELFDPMLWRFHPHYPIGLPLFNAWTWAFTQNSAVFAPLINAVLFNILMMMLMLAIIRQYSTNLTRFVPIAVLFLCPIHMIFMASQYCDIVIGLFLLAALGCIIEAQRSSRKTLFILSGLFLGTLSFLKMEGAILAGLIFIAAHFLLRKHPHRFSTLRLLWIGTIAGTVPTILFLLFLSPGSQDFINGFFSSSSPATFLRLKTILIQYCLESLSAKWNFLWIAIFIAGCLHPKKIFQNERRIFPYVLASYLLILTLYYWTNTYYDIRWWINNSFARILSSLLPTIIVWMSISLLPKKTPADSDWS